MWVGEFFFVPFLFLVYLWAFLSFFFDEYILPFTQKKKVWRQESAKKALKWSIGLGNLLIGWHCVPPGVFLWTVSLGGSHTT